MMEKRTKLYEEDYLNDISKDPGNLALYEDYKECIRGRIKEWENEVERRKERSSTNEGTKILRLFQLELEFLEAQDRNDYEAMQKTASELNPNWLAIVSRPAIVNCGRPNPVEDESTERWWEFAKDSHREATAAEWRKNNPRFEMDFVCPKKWNEMIPTENNKVRFCGDCQKNVYFCDNIIEARELGNKGSCIGLDVGVERKENDLQGEYAIFGRPRQEDLDAETERIKPDPVSEKRLKIKHSVDMMGKNIHGFIAYQPTVYQDKVKSE